MFYLKNLGFCFFIIINLNNPCIAQKWSALGQGVKSLNANDNILAITTDINDNIFVAGKFAHIDYDSGYNCVAKWDGNKWSILGKFNELEANDSILTLTTDINGNIYAAGKFKDKNGYCYVAKWNGFTWKKIGDLNANGRISKLVSDKNGFIYAGGDFKNDSGYCYISKWNDTIWQEVGAGSISFKSKAAINDILINKKGSIITSSIRIYEWDGLLWKEIGDLFNYVHTLAEDNQGAIYAAGDFVDMNNNKYVAKLEGNKWVQLGIGKDALNATGYISSILIDGSNNVYAAGWYMFDSTGNTYVAKWDGTTWSKLGNNTYNQVAYNQNNFIYALTFDNSGSLLAVGDYTDSMGRKFVARYGFPLGGLSNQTTHQSFSIYPNPSNGRITLQYTASKKETLIIYNNLGIKVYQTTILPYSSTHQIEISSLAKGIYFIQIDENIQKLIVE